MNKYTFSTNIRVRYADTDKMGVAYNGHYLAWFEVGRTELLRNAGLTYNDMQKEGFCLPLTRACVDFLKPAVYDDVLTVTCGLSHKPGVRIKIDYVILKENDVIATGFTEHAFTDSNLKPVRPPREIRTIFTKLWNESKTVDCEK